MGPRERQTRRNAKTHSLAMVIVSILGFFLLAGVAFGIGMMANINRWLSDLPDYTDTNQYLVSEPTNVLDANGNLIASLYVQNREVVALEQISPIVLKGTVATEDERFYEHGGIDLLGIGRALLVQLSGRSEGASTITQQLVRNTILSEEQFDVTIERKVREAFIAIKMEEQFSKDEILAMYLNTIYYGHGAYGIETAARTYFSKSSSELSLSEAALLIGIPNAPGVYDPTINPELALKRRNIVLARMLKNKVISQEEHDGAQAEELNLNVTNMPQSGSLAYPYFCDYVRSLLQDQFTTDMIFKGGLTVKTTIDPTIQAKAEEAAVSRLEARGADNVDVGLISIDPQTGYIKAMVGGRDYNATDAHVNHTLSRRSAGSAFKGLTLAAAIKAGMNPNIMLNCSSPMTFSKGGRSFTVQNYGNHDYGNRTLASATAVSSNTGYIQVQEVIGYGAIEKICSTLGIDTTDPVAEFRGQDNLTIGTCNITPLEMAEAYAAFANGGYHRDAVAITEILSRTGQTVYKHQDDPKQVLTPGQAAAVTQVLRGVMQGGGTGQGYMPNINQPVAGKTGTAGHGGKTTDVWFVGYTPQLCTSIWIGQSAGNYQIRYSTADLPLPIFKNFMTSALAGVERAEFPLGDTPTYKANAEWKFSHNPAEEEVEEEEVTEETTTATDGTEPEGEVVEEVPATPATPAQPAAPNENNSAQEEPEQPEA
ncbi:PBP1A family penicillin-binding protein [Collinsella sp. zg1085]|uniref:transglycosylase domain-containing protein n=1 Tax=Collinsella sp. zg1085 TaxID=2844380 RepID=UPI001C0CEB3E|nr:PBP1A family penicillin-binding protein [Collinsella sp. zg1085]QWT17307.1 PBP1A family penicillin-binding protein [Collinsella sp. zg1085]